MTNLDSLLKGRDNTLPTKVHIVKAMGFPVVRWRCESWTLKVECWRLFKLQCWRRLLAVSWTARRSNQSILKEINFEYSLEGLMLKLKPQYFIHLMQRADSLEKTLMLGNTEGRRSGWQRMQMVREHHWLNGHNLSKLWEIEGDRGAGHAAVHGSRRVRCDLATEQQQQQRDHMLPITMHMENTECWQ